MKTLAHFLKTLKHTQNGLFDMKNYHFCQLTPVIPIYLALFPKTLLGSQSQTQRYLNVPITPFFLIDSIGSHQSLLKCTSILVKKNSKMIFFFWPIKNSFVLLSKQMRPISKCEGVKFCIVAISLRIIISLNGPYQIIALLRYIPVSCS